MHKPAAANYSLLKNEHPWALREGKQEKMRRNRRREEMKFDSVCVCRERLRTIFLG